MQIGRYLKNIVLFSVFVIVSYPVSVILYMEAVPNYFHNNVFYEKFAYGFSNTRYKEVKATKNIDILFLGSSRAYRHYDTRIFKKEGFKTFNLGSSAQTFLQTEVLVDRYFDRLNPKYVVLDVFPESFSSDGVEASFGLISNDYNSWDTLKMALVTRNMKVINTWIYGLYREVFFDSLKDMEPVKNGENLYISGGYVERLDGDFELKDIYEQEWDFREDQWQSFTAIVEKIVHSDSELLIVHSPRNTEFIYHGGDKLSNYLGAKNLKYYNYKDLKFINDSKHFYDPTHLNQEGVRLYNNFLIQEHFK